MKQLLIAIIAVFISIPSFSPILNKNKGVVYCESKYHDTKKRLKVEEKDIPKSTPTPSEDIATEENTNTEQKQPPTENSETNKINWVGIIFHTKKGAVQNKNFEEIALKKISSAIYKAENIKLIGESIFKEKLEKMDVSENAIFLSPNSIIGRSADIDGIIAVAYTYTPVDKQYNVEIKFIFIRGVTIFKLNPEQMDDKNMDIKISNLANALVDKIKIAIENYYAKQSTSTTAEECFENGKSLNINKLYAQAIRELEKAIKIRPKMTKAYIELAFSVYMSTNDRKGQIEVLERGIKNNPKDLELHLELGKAYAAVGDKEKARENYNYIIVMDKEGKTEYSKEAERLISMLYFE